MEQEAKILEYLIDKDTSDSMEHSSSTNSKPSVDMTFLPEPFEWVQIPKGEVVISHPFYNIPNMVHTELPEFFISKYPITNDQYHYYLQHTGRKTKASPIQRAIEFSNGINPVVDIFYFEAIDFCKWLSQMIGHLVKLPSDSEWLRAARSDTTQQYPWGDSWNGTQCNTKESKIGHTTPVNKYLEGASVFGVMDMLGNTFEWCCTDPVTGKNQIDENPKDLNPFQTDTEVHRVFMGGSFESSIRGASLNRYGGGGATPISYPYVTGIRVVLKSKE